MRPPPSSTIVRVRPGDADRRRVQRLHLSPPLSGKVRAQRVHIMDVSLRGLRIAHQSAIGRIGDSVVVTFEGSGRTFEIECEIRRTELQRIGRASYSHTLYHSGLAARQGTSNSVALLREFVEGEVTRVLLEQKANARLTPRASDEDDLGAEFVRHELVDGLWRSTRTNDPAQVPNGFTTRASQSDAQVQALREAFKAGGAHEREEVREIADLRVRAAEGRPPGAPL